MERSLPRPVLDEAAQAVLPVLAREAGGDQVGLKREPGLGRQFGGGVDRLLGVPQGQRPAGIGEPLGDGGVEHLGVVDQAVGEADRERLV